MCNLQCQIQLKLVFQFNKFRHSGEKRVGKYINVKETTNNRKQLRRAFEEKE